MFNNIIYFIVVLLVFHLNYPDKEAERSFVRNIAVIFVFWIFFSVYCRIAFKRLASLYLRGYGRAAARVYHGLILRLSIMAILIFGLYIFMFHLKFWIQQIPLVEQLSVFQGLIAVSIFMLYLSTIWYFAWDAYTLVFNVRIKRRVFVLSNLKLNFPALLPWFVLTLIFDLLILSPFTALNAFLNEPVGLIMFFSVFLILLMVFMPALIQYWWGCRPLKDSEKVREIKAFLKDIKFRYRNLVNWPVFEGRMMTAGIMGIVPKYRYILITDSLMEVLTESELKSVTAHEAGHAKYRHQVYYILFFLGYFLIIMGLFDPDFYFVILSRFLLKYSITEISPNVLFALSSVPLIAALVIYFRFIIGFFMRHFERQADLYSAEAMGDSGPIISALEKIGALSGKIRDLPSWHHFSIKERVEYLERSSREKGLRHRHNRFLALAFAVYLLFVSGLIYFSWISPAKDHISYGLFKKDIQEQLAERPEDPDLLNSLAMIHIRMENHVKAHEIYEKLLSVNKIDATGLNNLAWILVTSSKEELRDNERGLRLAKEAVRHERNTAFLDTLAEAYWVNGNSEKAVEVIYEAIGLAGKRDRYLEKQLEKFLDSHEKKREDS